LKYGKSFGPQTRVVAINRSGEQLAKNEGLFWRSTLALQADVGLTLVALRDRLIEEGGWQGAPKEVFLNSFDFFLKKIMFFVFFRMKKFLIFSINFMLEKLFFA
jgi:hypothetical protein